MKVFSLEKCKKWQEEHGFNVDWVNHVADGTKVHCPKHKQMWVYSIDKKIKFLVSESWIEERKTK